MPAPTLRQSPFVFIIRITLGVFLLALALVVVAGAGIDRLYDASSAGSALSYPLLSALLVTAVQVVLIVTVFLSWYYPAYRLAAQYMETRFAGPGTAGG